jgi:hypothetical protein
MIEVDVMNRHREWHPWWRNFRDYYTARGVDMDNDEEITRTLAEWNAIDKDPESTVFYFENERDQILFLLRWS